MIIVVKPDGSTFTTAASIGYGSTVNEVSIVAPFTNGTMTIAFRLPNGQMLEPKLCTPAAATGTDYGVWTILLTADITAQAGTLGYIVKITDAYGKIWTSALGTFPVTDGVSTILPPIPGSTTYADILAVLSAINTNYQSIKNEIGEPSDQADPDGTIYARIADLVANGGGDGGGGGDGDAVQSDWNETNPNSLAYIKNKPNIGTPSDAANINGSIYARIAAKVTAEAGKGLSSNDYTNTDKSKVDGIGTTSDTANASGSVYARIAYNKSKVEPAFVNISYNPTNGVLTLTANNGTTKTVDLPLELIVTGGEYDAANNQIVLELANGDTIDIPLHDLGDVIVEGLGNKADKVTGAVNGNFAALNSSGNLIDSGKKASDFATAAQGTKADNAVPNTRTVNGKALSSNITLSASDVSAVPTTRTVNGKALSSNITLAASDVGAVASNQGSGNSGKFLVVGADGNVTLQTLAVWAGGSY